MLAQYHQGQMTVPRLLAQLRAFGIVISKRTHDVAFGDDANGLASRIHHNQRAKHSRGPAAGLALQGLHEFCGGTRLQICVAPLAFG